MIDLQIVIPSLQINRITFSQYLLYSKRVIAYKVQEKINNAISARVSMVKANDFRHYINSLEKELEGINKVKKLVVTISAADIIKKLDKQAESSFDEERFEWLELK